MASITLAHLGLFVIDAIALCYDLMYIRVGYEGFGGKYKYLTIWNITFQTIYFGLCFLKDVIEGEADIESTSDKPTLQRLRDKLHSTLAFPCGSFVVATFWILYAIDRELVYPKHLDGIVPSWLNHVLHTLVLPFLLLDKYLVHHQYPKKHVGIPMACSLALLYLAWILFIAWYDNFWVYPILEVLDTSQRIIFISMCLALFASLYILGESITTFLWRSEARSSRSSPSSRRRKEQ